MMKYPDIRQGKQGETTENVFERQGIQFKIIEKEMYAAVLDFLWDNFMPDEPINRSLGHQELGGG